MMKPITLIFNRQDPEVVKDKLEKRIADLSDGVLKDWCVAELARVNEYIA